MFGQTPPGLSKHSYFLSKLWQRKGFSRGPKAVARVKIMQTEGARILSVGAGAHRIIRRRWSPGLLVTDFRFYLASWRQVLTPTFCDVRRYLNFRQFSSFRYAIIPKDDAIIPKDDVTIPKDDVTISNCATRISNLSRSEKQLYRFLRVPVKRSLKLSSKVWHRCRGWALGLYFGTGY